VVVQVGELGGGDQAGAALGQSDGLGPSRRRQLVFEDCHGCLLSGAVGRHNGNNGHNVDNSVGGSFFPRANKWAAGGDFIRVPTALGGGLGESCLLSLSTMTITPPGDGHTAPASGARDGRHADAAEPHARENGHGDRAGALEGAHAHHRPHLSNLCSSRNVPRVTTPACAGRLTLASIAGEPPRRQAGCADTAWRGSEICTEGQGRGMQNGRTAASGPAP
jgi:hypothetical protein